MIKSMKKISIIGGSVAGCLAALVFERKGFDVKIFERSSASLNDRGAAVVIPTQLYDMLKNQNLIDAATPHLHHRNMNYSVNHKNEGQQHLWSFPTDVIALRWGHLYQQLRKRVNDKQYHTGASVNGISEIDNNVSITLNNGHQYSSDLVIAADGIHSYGRRYICGDFKPDYSGYILWRGLLNEQQIISPDTFADIYWSPYNGGLAGAYFIASPEGNIEIGQRTLNWGIYHKLPLTTLQSLIPELSIQEPTAYQLSTTSHRYLLDLAKTHLPAPIRNAVHDTRNPFVQPIVDIISPALVKGCTALIGDAAAVLRPHSASGISKAVQNVFSLAEQIEQADDLATALQDWEGSQQKLLQEQSKLTKNLGRGLVTDAPDWNTMTTADMPGWWESMISGSDWYINKAKL